MVPNVKHHIQSLPLRVLEQVKSNVNISSQSHNGKVFIGRADHILNAPEAQQMAQVGGARFGIALLVVETRLRILPGGVAVLQHDATLGEEYLATVVVVTVGNVLVPNQTGGTGVRFDGRWFGGQVVNGAWAEQGTR